MCNRHWHKKYQERCCQQDKKPYSSAIQSLRRRRVGLRLMLVVVLIGRRVLGERGRLLVGGVAVRRRKAAEAVDVGSAKTEARV